jgi:hypothetical protein
MVWARGSLYIGGYFTAVGGVAARNVARWDGHHWHSLGASDENGVGYRATARRAPEDEVAGVRALAVAPNGDVYVGGTFDQAGRSAAACLARWDGWQWSAVGDFLHLEDSIQHHLPAQAARQWAQQHRRVNAGDGAEYVVLDEPSPHCEVRALAVTAEGTLYAGGTFHYAASAYPADTMESAVIRWNGTAWTVPGQGLPGVVHALTRAPDGRVYAGGDFGANQPDQPDMLGRVACWNGTTWATIGTSYTYYNHEQGAGMPGVVYALAVAPGGALYTAGANSGYERGNVARWNGHAWQLLSPGPYQGVPGTVNALAVDSHRVYAAGNFSPYPWKASNPARGSRVAVWDGRTWHPLDPTRPTSRLPLPEHSSTVAALAVAPTGTVYVGGRLTELDHGQQLVTHYLARWAGQQWDNLPQVGSQGLDGDVLAVAVAASGQVYAGGTFGRAGGAPARGLAIWNGRTWAPLPLGCLVDSTERPTLTALALATDGQLYAGAGPYTQGPRACRLARWDGRAWHPLGTGLHSDSPTDRPGVQALVADQRGGVYVSGNFSTAGGLHTPNVAHWNGRAWEALGAGLPGAFYVSTLAVAPNGDLYAGGHISLEPNRASFPMVVRWNGRAWSRVGGFADAGMRCSGAGNTGEVYALAVTPTGELYVGGIFSAVDGVPAQNLARWDGTAWQAVGGDPPLNFGCQVHALALTPNGDLYVGGEFETEGPVRARNLVRWDGRAWHALEPGLNGSVLALAWASGDRLLVGGGFTTLGHYGAATSHFAMLGPAACQPASKPVGLPRAAPARRGGPGRPVHQKVERR